MKKFILILLLTLNLVALAEIRDAPTMANALLDTDAESLVIFDLDNTVLTPPQSLGGEEWFDYFVDKRTKQFIAEGMTEEKAKEKAINMGVVEWTQFHRNAKVIPVDSDTPLLIEGLQKKGAKTIALTARNSELADSTFNELKSIGVDFTKNTVTKSLIKVSGKITFLLKHGTVFVGSKNNKGEVLVTFLKKTGYKPKKIFFIDNKIYHVENVERSLKPLGIEYHGRRLGSADAKIKAMNAQVLELQHRYFFGDVLSNQQAEILLNAKP